MTVVCREWRMLAGMAISAVCQLLVVAFVAGWGIIQAFSHLLAELPRFQSFLGANPYQLHSLRAVTSLLPSWLGGVIWLFLSVPVLLVTVRSWRSQMPVTWRMSVLVLATLLVSPHLPVYDAAVLALPCMWIGGWIKNAPALGERETAGVVGSVYLWYVFYLVPSALFLGIQVSVLILFWTFFRVARLRELRAAPS
jgi:hypothetical protein